jgi:hypothetical protein
MRATTYQRNNNMTIVIMILIGSIIGQNIGHKPLTEKPKTVEQQPQKQP